MAYQNLSAWLTYLESLSAQRSIKQYLGDREQRFKNFKKIAHHLNLLQWNCPIITVAGTNGKGSCVALLAFILKAAGYRVGTFTSPHLLRYNERIQIDNEPVADHQLCAVFEIIYQALKKESLGYFEYSTLAALSLFKKVDLDIIILEVGVGGRLDPVNSIDCTVAIISSVDFDHTRLLGHSIEAIAFEKAGIMRPGQPAIWGDTKVPAQVKQYAQTLGALLWVQAKDFEALPQTKSWQWRGLQKHLIDLPLPKMLYLPNAACVLQAIEYLNEHNFPISKQAIDLGLQTVQLPGRFQIIAQAPIQIILDVAHNPASARLLAQNLASLSGVKRLFAVVGMLAKKDIANSLAPLTGQVTHWYLGSLAIPSGETAENLGRYLQAHSVMHYSVFSNIKTAYTTAVKAAKPGDAIIVFGSFHTVEAVMKLTD